MILYMAQIKFYSGLDNSIKSKPIENGAIYLSTDSNKLNKFYVDLNGIRYKIGDIPIGNLTTAGAVKPDGVTIEIDSSGTISSKLKTVSDAEFLEYMNKN